MLKLSFPTNPPFKDFINKNNWLDLNIPFFSPENTGNIFNGNDFKINIDDIENRANEILNHTFTFLSSIKFNLGSDYNWITNPETGYAYDINKHWSNIIDISKEAGDIKYVWEKSRFTFIYDLIRYDFHFKKDSSKFILNQIENFINKNPINQGPNYKCSQEISLRILNWTYAIFYYKKSEFLTNKLFSKIINSIYWQLKHVYNNINFSRISVRNNHAITETAMLYMSGFLFPFMDETKKWSRKGRKWLLKEINFQIYDDGSYLQFSHNYHRVVIQTLTWILKINQLHEITFPKSILDRIELSLNFLFQHMEEKTGWLPNYGNNDGALFFPFNGNHYRDFRPQLQALAYLLGIELYKNNYEDIFWFGINPSQKNNADFKGVKRACLLDFPQGGFYGMRDNTLTTIRCGSYKDRPSQADALNLDIWCNGVNIIRDPGTYKYNTDDELLRFYNGTRGHNTLSIENRSQMTKGSRFIWFFWTKYARAKVNETQDTYEFEGEIIGFREIGKNIKHTRKIIKYKNKNKWKIIDTTNYRGRESVLLHWNLNPEVKKILKLVSFDKDGEVLKSESKVGWYSELYGIKNKVEQLIVIVPDGYAKTVIELI